MATDCTIEGGSPFRIKRPLITTSGFVSDVDATIKLHLDDLNQLLGKRIFRKVEIDKKTKVDPEIKLFLKDYTLTPKRINGKWAAKCILNKFSDAKEELGNFTLSDYIDMTPELSELKYAIKSNLSVNWFNLDYNTKAVLDDYPAITDYLIAYAFHVQDVENINGLKNFILSNTLGVKNVADYARVSAARSIIAEEQITVSDSDNDDNKIFTQITSPGLSLSSASFKKALLAIIHNHNFNKNEYERIEEANLGELTPRIRSLLVKYIKNSPIKVTKDNAKSVVPMLYLQMERKPQLIESAEVDIAESDEDFKVHFLQDDNSLIQINVSAVKCAAQLYYGMVLGDELDVFSIVNYFTHKYLIRGGINITDARLREDLQLYVFSNRFTDLKTNKIVDNTRPAERQMFYRQVFNYGNAQITDDVIVNTEFTKLWKVLILESAKYIERRQDSFHLESLSSQNVLQSVEDLQYNLSTHCTGMANVITPLIYAELNFVIQRIFMHKDILQQIVPAGGTWWRVVETLYMGMRNARPKATVLYNKAKLGHDIIRSIAEYDPATFEDENTFAAFISNVDAFITTQSILQESLTDELKKGDEEEEPGQNESQRTVPEVAEEPAASAARADGKEWDF